jgi:hypothetical protein
MASGFALGVEHWQSLDGRMVFYVLSSGQVPTSLTGLRMGYNNNSFILRPQAKSVDIR